MRDKSFRECAIEYLSQFDVITRDTINIYNFLDYYGYHHNAYDEARALLFDLCWFELAGWVMKRKNNKVSKKESGKKFILFQLIGDIILGLLGIWTHLRKG